MKTLLLIAILAAVSVFVSANDDYCFGKDNERTQTRQFGTKTAYQIVKGTHIHKQYLVPNCVAQKIWILHRYGTNLPSKSFIQDVPRLEELRNEILKNYYERKTKPATNPLCQIDLIALKMWKWNNSITAEQEFYLSGQGYDDLRATARLYQKYYPEILSKQFDNAIYTLRHTNAQRTEESFKAFAEGLFGPRNNAEAQPAPEHDLLLQPNEYCDSWNNKDDKTESQLFRKSQLWNNTLTTISARLGFEYALSEKDILLIYDICRYEQAWQVDRTSVWCAAFLPNQVDVLEYDEDLQQYYQHGYGNDENTQLSCHAVQDMLNQLNSNATPNVIAYFTHSTNLQTLLTALGINKDDNKLTADNFAQLRDRRWKTSLMNPFAANFVAVKYNCAAHTEREKVVFFLNQDAVEFDWCNVGLCSWSEVWKRFEHIRDANCDSYYCRSGTAALSASLFSVLALFVYLIM